MREVKLLQKDPRARGVEHGTILRPEIHEIQRLFLLFLSELPDQLFYDAFIKRRFWKTKLGQAIIRHRYYLYARRFVPFLYRFEYRHGYLLEEMAGIAEGAEVDFDFVLAFNFFNEITQILSAQASVNACSALAVKTPRGWLVGCNNDYGIFVNELAKLATLFRYESSVVFGYPGFVGALMGMNTSGVVLQQLNVPATNACFSGMPTSFTLRVVLDRAKSWNSALNMLSKIPKSTGGNVMVAGSQHAEVFEMSPTLCCRVLPYKVRMEGEEFLRYSCATNHFTHPDMQSFMGVRPSLRFSFALDPWHYTNEFSQSRLRRLHEFVREYFPQSPIALHSVLAQPSVTGKDIENCCGNVACMIFNPTRREYWFADNNGKIPAAEGKLARRSLIEGGV